MYREDDEYSGDEGGSRVRISSLSFLRWGEVTDVCDALVGW